MTNITICAELKKKKIFVDKAILSILEKKNIIFQNSAIKIEIKLFLNTNRTKRFLIIT